MSADRNNSSRPEDAVERAAAEWSLRIQSGLRANEQREFEAWLERDPRHAAVFAEMDETAHLLDRLRDPALAGANVVPFEAPFVADSAPVSVRRRWLWTMAIAAAAVMVMAGLMGVRIWQARDNYTASFATEVGASRTVNLPDGSVLQLNTDSAVEAAYSAGERRVRLKRGEAFFSVAKNPQRPFWVDADAISVRAVGTAFNVRFRSQSVQVLVKEGKVSVNQAVATAPGPTVSGAVVAVPAHFLVAGEQATVALPTQGAQALPPVVVAAVAAPRLESALAWQGGRLEFTDTPLTEGMSSRAARAPNRSAGVSPPAVMKRLSRCSSRALPSWPNVAGARRFFGARQALGGRAKRLCLRSERSAPRFVQPAEYFRKTADGFS